MTRCKRGCCWTPTQICARQRSCRCHTSDPKPRTFSDLLEEARAQRAREDHRPSGMDRRRA